MDDPINVKDFGAMGDGTTDDTAAITTALTEAFGSFSNPHGNAMRAMNQRVYFPNGTFNITSPLKIRSLTGATIFGAGRFSTTIQNVAGTSVFQTNGCQFSKFSDMQLSGTGTAIVFDLDWDGTGDAALQSNTFFDILFNGGAEGCRIGKSQAMGSENLFLHCFFNGHSVAGLSTENFNACCNTVLNGDIQSCNVGILVNAGSVPIIHGVSCQLSSKWDIWINNGAYDCYSIAGIRTESANFLYCPVPSPDCQIAVSGCNQANTTSGVFINSNANCTVDSCSSVNGQIKGSGTFYFRAWAPLRADWGSQNPGAQGPTILTSS